MATIAETAALAPERAGSGWVETRLADERIFGAAAMVVRRIEVAAAARAPGRTRQAGEEMLYVIVGSGALHLGDEVAPLGQETVVWLEPDDRYTIEGGTEGIELLHVAAQAPS